METGVVRACSRPSVLKLGDGARVGLFTNFTGTMPDLSRNVEALRGAGVSLQAIFTPEHGMWGSAPAGESEPSGTDEATGLPIEDTYGCSGAALDEVLTRHRITDLLVDFQDVGVRFYTYLWTLYDVFESARRVGIRVTVLDRPNPIARLGVRGPGLAAGVTSFVGRVGIPIITGSTIGEVARHFARVYLPGTEVEVVGMDGWSHGMTADAWGVPWVPTSPAIPTVATAAVYPGMCLLEGTNLSEGRGTALPFLQVGAPWIDGELAQDLRRLDLPGVAVRKVVFLPTASKHVGERCHGVQFHVLDTGAFDPLLTATTLLQLVAGRYPDFEVLAPRTPERPCMLDLLWGSDTLRLALERGHGSEAHQIEPLDALVAASPTPSDPTQDWMYD